MAMGRCRWQGLVMVLCVCISTGCTPVKRWGRSGDAHQPTLSPPPSVPVQDKVEAKPAVVAPVQEFPTGYRISGDDPLVAARALFYEKTLNDWRETVSQLAVNGGLREGANSWRDCLLAAEQALAGYHSLQVGQDESVNPWQIVARDVDYFDKGCDQVLVSLHAAGAGIQSEQLLPTTDSDALRTQLRQYYEAGDYMTTITTYEAMTSNQEKVSPEVRMIYGKSLIKTGRFEDAARIYTEILAEVGQSSDLDTLELKMETADVLLAAGRLEDARQVYQRQVQVLSPLVSQKEWAEAHARAFAEPADEEDMERYRAVMQAYLQFDGKQVPSSLTEGVDALEKRPPGPLLDLSRIMLAEVRGQSQLWVRGQMSEIRSLIDAKKFDQAQVLLDQVLPTAPPEMMGVITQFQTEIAQAQALEQSAPGEIVAPETVDPWEEAMGLFEHQKYDEAIVSFQQFFGTERDTEAQAKVAEASELAAAALRRQAAALYAKARNTFDPELKRQTLQSSRALLVQLVEKYPQSTVADKARQNMKVIDAELGISPTTPSLP